jgi:membrane protease YdiL (CAAX protease family)
VAALCQALLFGLAHAYLGPRGVLNASAIGLVSAGVFLADGRNLWPLIVAHGLVDTVGLTLIRFGVGHG